MNRRDFLAAAALAPFALRATRPRALALVTADLEAELVVVGLDGRVHGRIPTLDGPRTIETVGGRTAVVAHAAVGAVTIVEGLHVRSVLHDFTQPRYTAAHPDGRHAYVSDSKRGDVAVIDVRRGELLARTPEIGGPARHISIDPSGRMLWVGLGFSAAEVVAIDVSNPVRPRPVRRILPPYHAHDVAFAPDGRHVWVTSGDQRTLGIWDAATRRLVHRLPADLPPQHVSFSPQHAFVTSGDSGKLRVFTLAGRLVHTTAVPVGSYNVQRAGGVVLTPSLDAGTLVICDVSGRLLHAPKIARSSHDACVVYA